MRLLYITAVLTACSGGDFNAGLASRLDSGTPILDSVHGSDAATAERVSSRVEIDGDTLQPRDSGVALASGDSSAKSYMAVRQDSGNGGRGNASDSGLHSTGGAVPQWDAHVASDAGSIVSAGGTCGKLDQRCPCCHGLTCQLGLCL